MSLKVDASTIQTLLEVAGSAASGGGSVNGLKAPPTLTPGVGGDDFQTAQMPFPLPAPGVPGGADPIYKFQLHNMSGPELNKEKFNQQLNLVTSLLTGNVLGAAESRGKLGAIQQEQTRRNEGQSVQMALYKQNLAGMSDAGLRREERKQQGSLWLAGLTGNAGGMQAAKEKLEAIHHEQLTRPVDFLKAPPLLAVNREPLFDAR